MFGSFVLQSCFFSAGSYPYAESYIFENINDSSLISNIINFKIKNQQYCPKVSDSIYSVRGHYYYYEIGKPNTITNERDDKSMFHCSDFYIPDINATVSCVINVSKSKNQNNSSILMLTGVTYSSSFGKWKTINNNKEIDKKENQMIKKKFETEVLNNLGKWKSEW